MTSTFQLVCWAKKEEAVKEAPFHHFSTGISLPAPFPFGTWLCGFAAWMPAACWSPSMVPGLRFQGMLWHPVGGREGKNKREKEGWNELGRERGREEMKDASVLPSVSGLEGRCGCVIILLQNLWMDSLSCFLFLAFTVSVHFISLFLSTFLAFCSFLFCSFTLSLTFCPSLSTRRHEMTLHVISLHNLLLWFSLLSSSSLQHSLQHSLSAR